MPVAITIYIFKLFTLYWSIADDVVKVSGGPQREPAIHIHVSILPQTPLPSRLPHNIEQGSLCYIEGPCWLSILNMSVPSQYFH